MSFAGRRALTQLGSTGTQRAIIRDLLGPKMSWGAIRNIGTATWSYTNTHLINEDKQWNATRDLWNGGGSTSGEGGGAYYDRSSFLYQLYALTGDSRYKTRADLLCANLRNNYFIPNAYGQSLTFLWTQPRSQYIDYRLNGTPAALDAIGKLADYALLNYWQTQLAIPRYGTDLDPRNIARMLQAVIWAKYSNAPSSAGNVWSTILPTLLTNALAWQDADGAVRYPPAFHSKSFMEAIFADVLIDYWRLIAQDSRIQTCVQGIVDYLWANHWDDQLGALYYMDGDDTGEPTANFEGTVRSGDLNQFTAGIFWWVYARTGTTAYRDRGDRIFIEGVNRNINSAPLQNKQYNESYANLYRYFDDRGLAPMVSSSLNLTRNADGSMTWTVPFTAGWTDLGAGSASDGVGHAWSQTLNGFGAAGLVAYVGPQPSYGVKGRALVHIKMSSGTHNAYLSGTDDNIVTGQPDGSIAYSVTTSWQWIGITDTVLMNGGTGTYALRVTDGSDGLGSRTIIVDAVDIGLGDSVYTPTLVPFLSNLRDAIKEPTVSGTYTVGSVLTATTGVWLNSPTSRTWQWFRDGLPISSATSSTYTLVSADSGKYIYVRETPSNAAGAGIPVKSRTPTTAVS